MKKVLLATSALVMFAGAASAEIALSGSARMGIIFADNGSDSDVAFSSRVRINFTASGETDGGLSFGASVRHDQDDSAGDFGTENGENTVFISGAFGKITMGDASSASDALVGQISGVGYGPFGGASDIVFLGNHKTAALYEYSTGALSFAVGSGQLIDGDRTYSVAAKYSTDAFSVAAGWETDTLTDQEFISLSGSATFGAATVKAKVTDTNDTGRDTAFGLSVDYTTGATTITGFFIDYGNSALMDGDFFSPDPNVQHMGVGVAYDLGGGATLAGGIIQQNNEFFNDVTVADLGLKFSF